MNEGFGGLDAEVVMSGDVMQDEALFYSNLAQKPSALDFSEGFILCTIHRAENTDDIVRMSNIVSALNDIARSTRIILPLHPRTKQRLTSLSVKLSTNISVIEPVGYLNMVWLIKYCSTVMTDSGGLQKEAFFFRKPCITLRDETEWVELVDNGFNLLVGADERAIKHAFFNGRFASDFDKNLYGGGKASENIVSELKR